MSFITDRFKTRYDETDNHKQMLRNQLKILANDGKRLGQEQVYEEIRKAFQPDDAFKGRLWFDDAEKLIQLIQIRLKDK